MEMRFQPGESIAPLSGIVDGGVKPGGTFYGNIIKSSLGQAVGVWVPTFGGFHTPARFGEFHLAATPERK